jgi:DNA (cytosine-5)-methyltransferase 1
LFAGIGGNRTLWGDIHEITAVEIDPDIAGMYNERFPNDIIIIGDAIEYMRHNFEDYDFIWLSPPCITHTRLVIANYGRYGIIPELPDLTNLYGSYIFLKKFFKGLFVIENVDPWYEVPIPPTVLLSRHSFWSNFQIPEKLFSRCRGSIDKIPLQELAEYKKIDLEWLKTHKICAWKRNYDVYRTLLRNMVDAEIGKYILDCIDKKKQLSIEVFK